MEPMPSAIYVWLVRSEEVLDQPGSWRIRKWDIAPFAEANFAVPSETAACSSYFPNEIDDRCIRWGRPQDDHRAPSDDKRQRGIYEKFRIERTDGKSAPGEKHDGCEYFVLDFDHDKHAVAAIEAYAASCEAEYPVLAADLRYKALRMRESFGLVAPSAEVARSDTERLNWLERMVVEVRAPLQWGSRHLFIANPTEVEGMPDDPSDLRAQIDYQRNGGKKP